MEYSHEALARLTIQALILGAVLGLLYSLLKVTRVLFGEKGHHAMPHKLSTARLPLIGSLDDPAALKRRGKPFLWGLTFLEDVLFCVGVSIGILLLAFVGNNGRIRWFLLLGTLVGFTVFRVTCGRVIAYFSEILATLLRILFRYLAFFLSFPFKMLGKGVKKLFSSILTGVRKRLDAKREAAFRKHETDRLLDTATTGFGCGTYLGIPLTDLTNMVGVLTEQTDAKRNKKSKGVNRHGKSGRKKPPQ